MRLKKTICAACILTFGIALVVGILYYSPLAFCKNFIKQMYSITYVNYHQSITDQRNLYDDAFRTYVEQNPHDNGAWIVEEKASYHLFTPIKVNFKTFSLTKPVLQCAFELLIDNKEGRIFFQGDVAVQINLIRTGLHSYEVSFLK
mgnify:FL=1